MARPRKPWSLSVGAPGHTVTVYERMSGGPLWLRWWVPVSDGAPARKRYRALKHTDRNVAEETAREVAAQLLASHLASERRRATLAEVLACYEADVSTHTKGQGRHEAERRAAIWTAFLGANRDVDTIDFPTLDRFARDRRSGAILAPPYELKASPSDRAVQADLEYLRAALNHATRVIRPNGQRMLTANPMSGYALPKNRNPRRPVATYDRFLAVVAKADAADPQGLFGSFMALVEGLGWRVSAICALRASDVDRRATPATPHGRIHKRPEHDKEQTGGWLPMSQPVRTAIDTILAKNPAIGEWPLFPAPRAKAKVASGKDEIPKPWSRHHARKLLARAEAAAKLDPLDGGDFHPYRRKWATERKHLPVQDVAKAGAWLDTRALQGAYQQTDEKTMLAVVSEPTKLREPKKEEQAGAG